MNATMSFSRNAGYERVRLTTFAGLDAARKLYDRLGFVELSTFKKTNWDFPITMQTLECRF